MKKKEQRRDKKYRKNDNKNLEAQIIIARRLKSPK